MRKGGHEAVSLLPGAGGLGAFVVGDFRRVEFRWVGVGDGRLVWWVW